MKVWTAKFDGVWMQGHAVVVAVTALDAALWLNCRCRERGLTASVTEGDMVELDTTVEGALILNDGDY